MNASQLAQRFHEIYEARAPEFGYQTRTESSVPWVDVPQQNKNLMIAVCSQILEELAPKPPSSDAQEVFEFWKKTFNKNGSTKFDRKRKSKVQARLKEGYTVEEIKKGILGCSKNPYNIENAYTDLELICRDASKLDRYIALNGVAKTPDDDWQNDNWTYAMLMDIQEAEGGEMYHDRQPYEQAKARFLAENPTAGEEIAIYERSYKFKQRFGGKSGGLYMTKHTCPRCGNETEGSQSEGGITWAICGDCMGTDVSEYRETDEYDSKQNDNIGDSDEL